MKNNYSAPIDKYIPMVYITPMTSKELKMWRQKHSYSQTNLAKALGVAVMTVSRWETETRAIPVFLHLALRCLELEGGETNIREMKTKRRL